MEHRIGKCSACGAQYKIPASFAADKAKCKKCGGMVEVGPVEGGTAPTAQPVPARKAAGADGGRRKEGPSMKERILAERRAGQPAAAKPQAGEERPARAGAPPARAGARAGGASSRRAGGSSRSSARHAGRGRDKEVAEDGGDEGDGARGRRRPQKKSPAPLVGGVVLLLVIAFGVWKLAGGSKTQAGEPDTTAAVADASPAIDEPVALTALDDETTGAEDEAADEATEEPAEEAPAKEKPETIADPSSYNVRDEFPEDFGPVDGTSAEEWTEIKQLAVTMIDPEAGAAGNRARETLKGLGKKAFPAILNVMMDLDFGTETGFRDGDLCQKTLMEICNGQNFDWRYSTEPADHLFNKKVVRAWCIQWDKAKDSEEYWIKLAKLDKQEEKPEGKPDLGVSEKELDELDDF